MVKTPQTVSTYVQYYTSDGMEYYNEEIKEDEVQHLPNYMNLSIHITYL